MFNSSEMIAVVIACVALGALWFYSKIKFDYWKNKGVRYEQPLPLFGNNLQGVLQKKTIAQYGEEYYKKYPNERVVGFYKGFKPELIIRDPEYVRRILTQDFMCFHSRGLQSHPEVTQPLRKHLFNADGDLWKLVRQRVTPTFSSGKLKGMFPLIVERAEKLKTRILTSASKNSALDAKDLMARYTTDFIGACGFGIDADSLNEEESEFRKLGKIVVQFKLRDVLVLLLKDMFPSTMKNLELIPHIEAEMKELVGSILRKRNYQPSGRGDFVDLLLECKNMGTIYGESIERAKNGVPEKVALEFDEEIIRAQMFVFFVAGFETSSSATSFTLHQLAYHPEIQEKVQKEIDHVLAKYDGKLSYDAVKEMTYLEWTLKEGLRMFSSLGFLLRKCVKTYTFPEINLTIEPGVKIMIPIQALHMDPQYFKEPEKFRPERFHPDEFGPIQKQVYLPFGDGPRNCVGARLGLMQSTAGLAAVLSAYSVEPAPETNRYPDIDTTSPFISSFKGELLLRFKQRKPINGASDNRVN